MKHTYLHTLNIAFSTNDPISFISEKETLTIPELEFIIEEECKQRQCNINLFELEVIDDLGFPELYSNLVGCVVETKAKIISIYE